MNEKRELEPWAPSDPRDLSVWESAIGRTEAEWLDIVEYLVLKLTSLVGPHIEVGPYWIGSGPNGASFCARIRSDDFPFCPAESWEGSFCISSNRERSWMDLEVFPFLQRQRVDPGRLWWFQYERSAPDSVGNWVSRGWRSDEYGEWESVEEPGDAFRGADTPIPDAISFTALKPRFALAEPKLIRVELVNDSLQFGSRIHGDATREPACFSIHAVRRVGQDKNLIQHRRLGLPQCDGATGCTIKGGASARVVNVELGAGVLASGWTAGCYEVILRARCLSNDEGSSLSYLSLPIALEVGPS